MNLQLKTNVVKWDDAIKSRRLWDQDGFGNLNVFCISQSKSSGFLYAIRRSTLEKLDVVKCKVINSQCPICILDCEATQIHLIKIITGVSRLRNSADKCWSRIICICHIHNYTEYNQQWNVFSAFNPSECTHTHFVQWAADAAAPGEQLGVRCIAQTHNLGLQVRRSIH